LTGGEAIDLLGRLRGGLDEKRRAHLLERFELDPTKRGRQYSKGNKQKVAVVAALASDVELLILDEPTSGLDPLMEAVFQEEIAAEKARGRTILLSSHILSEAEALADRVSIIRLGRVVETGTLDALRAYTRTTVHAVLADPSASLDGLRALRDPRVEGGRLSATVERRELTAALAELSRYDVTALTVAPPSLEDLFLRHYGERTGTAAAGTAAVMTAAGTAATAAPSERGTPGGGPPADATDGGRREEPVRPHGRHAAARDPS
jgi:ABC-2 type transport system ATP-binding protein